VADITGYEHNLETILRAAKDKRLVIADVFDTRLGRSQATLVAVSNVRGSDELAMVPLAVMCEGDPYEYRRPPDEEGGYYPLEKGQSSDQRKD
jgi:hypothetical protein